MFEPVRLELPVASSLVYNAKKVISEKLLVNSNASVNYRSKFITIDMTMNTTI